MTEKDKRLYALNRWIEKQKWNVIGIDSEEFEKYDYIQKEIEEIIKLK